MMINYILLFGVKLLLSKRNLIFSVYVFLLIMINEQLIMGFFKTSNAEKHFEHLGAPAVLPWFS